MRNSDAIKGGIVFALLVAIAVALAAGTALGTTTTCSNPATLAGSAFEVDTNANLVVNTSGCQDWLTGGTGTPFRPSVLAQNDKPSGSQDNAFGQGTAENDANPTVVDGSIPPNKSDLKAFGVYTENGQVTAGNPTGKNLALFWSRVQNPSGTTNMDFELNQKVCDFNANPTNCANNGNLVPPEAGTPVRTTGDKLITYDLSKGGTVPTISIRTWSGSAWGSATVISGGASPSALGSVNTSLIPANQTGGVSGGLTTALGSQDPFTFGEATVSFGALFGTSTCGKFGSAYLKSRSSDSFTAEIKDFVAPERVSISNCASMTTQASGPVTLGSPIHDTATLNDVTANAGGTITFKAFSDSNCSNLAFTSNAIPVSGPGNYDSNNFTPTAAGTYYWTATYTGDASNQSASTACRDANESSVVNKVKPSLSTQASGPVTIGSAIHDTATLSGGGSPTGTITFHVFSDSNCSTEVTPAGGLSATVNNGNGNYTSGDFTPTATGTYYWTASYSGDSNNESVLTACGDANESSVVNKAKPSIATTLSNESITVGDSIHDSAVLSNATSDAGGTVTYTVYTDNQCTLGARDAGTKTVTNGLVPNSDTLQFNSPGTFYWQASYSGDSKNEAAKSVCTTETLVVGKAPSSISTAQKLFPQDSATLTANAGGTPTGSVTFKLFGPDNPTCDPSGAAAKYTETVALTNGTANTNNTTVAVNSASADNYKWLVVYGGDNNHDGTTSTCGKENFTLTIDNG